MRENNQHNGGPPIAALTIGNTGDEVILVKQDISGKDPVTDVSTKLRAYVIMRADKGNDINNPIFIHQGEPILSPAPDPFVVGKGGIPLWPGDTYEILGDNLYLGTILGACAAGGGGVLHIEVGF
jgi:hypothetical protein